MENFEEELKTIKETLIFLVEQEKIRGDEVNALNDKIEAVNDYMINNIVNPSIDAYKESQFNDFNQKYGDRLGKYNDTLKLSMNNPDYDATKEAFNELDGLSAEERANVDEDAYVDGVEKGLAEYVDNIKQSLGISEETAVEIKEDGDGNIEVKEDTNNDGEPDTVVSEETEKVEEAPAPVEEGTSVEDEEEATVDPELQKQLDEYMKK